MFLMGYAQPSFRDFKRFPTIVVDFDGNGFQQFLKQFISVLFQL